VFANASTRLRSLAAVTVDRGVTHVAMPVTDLEVSLAFYERFADMHVVHRRTDPGGGNSVAWISDLTRPFVVVLIEVAKVDERLGGVYGHLGLGVSERDEVDRRCAAAKADGYAVFGPIDSGPPVGYWGYIVDPDGHNLELSYGQEVGLTVDHAR
jgi:catechol 2,3-dioxygenase-like lactoylglutathione lyase family enzyme